MTSTIPRTPKTGFHGKGSSNSPVRSSALQREGARGSRSITRSVAASLVHSEADVGIARLRRREHHLLDGEIVDVLVGLDDDDTRELTIGARVNRIPVSLPLFEELNHRLDPFDLRRSEERRSVRHALARDGDNARIDRNHRSFFKILGVEGRRHFDIGVRLDELTRGRERHQKEDNENDEEVDEGDEVQLEVQALLRPTTNLELHELERDVAKENPTRRLQARFDRLTIRD